MNYESRLSLSFKFEVKVALDFLICDGYILNDLGHNFKILRV